MKRFLALITVLFGFLNVTAHAQDMDKGMARGMHDRSMSMVEKLKRAPQLSLATGAKMSGDEQEFVNRLLPEIEKNLLRAGELFGQAAELLPSPEGKRCVREGCETLKTALHQVARGRQMVQNSSMLSHYNDILRELKDDIEASIRDAKCDGNRPDWNGKVFRSTYTSPNGQPIRGETQLNGGGGSYRIDSGERGQFERVNYRDGGRIAEGFWRFQNGARGWFSFTLSHDGRSFQGVWGNGDHIGQQQAGQWQGNL